MSATLLGALVTAGVLGVTHAMEPDHVAGISSLTSRYGDPRLSAIVGACFSAGHVALVVLWLVIGYLLLGRTDYPAVFDAVGTLGVAVLLGVLGAVMAVGGLRSVLHTHEHEHDGEVHAHSHLHLPVVGSGGHDRDDGHQHDVTVEKVPSHVGSESSDPGHSHDGVADHEHPHHEHGHGVGSYLKTGLVGALFTLSPPLSMILFSSTLFPRYGASAVALAVVVYAVAITATMSLIGAGVGSLFGTVTDDPRAYGAFRTVGGVLVAAFGVFVGLGAVPSLV